MSYEITIRARDTSWTFSGQQRIPDLAGPVYLTDETGETVQFNMEHIIYISWREEGPAECPEECGCSGCSEGNCCDHVPTCAYPTGAPTEAYHRDANRSAVAGVVIGVGIVIILLVVFHYWTPMLTFIGL